MNSTHAIVGIFTLLIGGIAATYAAIERPPESVTCTKSRVVAFGWTSKQTAFAELAAIERWQQTVEKKRPGFRDWHQAYKRSMNCRKFGKSNHFQCQVSALPCRVKES